MTRPTRLALPIVIVVATVTAAVGEELTPTEGLAPAEELAPIDVELTTGPQRPPPISVFTGASEVGGITISPSGRYLTAAIRQGDEAEFQIIKDPERETTVNIGLGTEREVIQVVWLSDELALFRQSKRVLGRDYKSTTGEFATIHAETGHIQRAGAGALIDILPDQPDHVLIQGGSDRFAEAYRVDIRSRRPMKVARSAAPQGSFVPNAEGEILVSIGVNTDNEQEIHTRESTSGRWNLVATYGLDDEGWLPVHAGPRAKTYYTYDSRGGSTAGLGLYDAAANTHRMLLRHPDVDVSSLLYDHAGRNAYAVRFDHHYPQVMYLIKNHPLARMHASLQQKYPDDTVSLVSMTRDNQKAIALITSDRKPGDYFLVDVAAQKIEHLKSRKPQLKPEMLSPVSPIELQTRDDETIYGYVTSSPRRRKARADDCLRTWRPARYSRLLGLRRHGSVVRQPGVPCAAGKLPGVGRLRCRLPTEGIRRVGSADAGRRDRRHALGHSDRYRGSGPNLHPRRKLRGVFRPGRCGTRSRSIPLRRSACRESTISRSWRAGATSAVREQASDSSSACWGQTGRP